MVPWTLQVAAASAGTVMRSRSTRSESGVIRSATTTRTMTTTGRARPRPTWVRVGAAALGRGRGGGPAARIS
ncbi:hypothetical protein GCM10017667_72870 [Streptomyces filamentosus]|uniref:Uncharacterized protein n=1 Tax=Streptomyces filamentosus TaxID=67294 RepID=A0A919ERM4_STRFL|nr:hypothetical protein GCM10017667_72870 [Streptomyces filamentosus]